MHAMGGAPAGGIRGPGGGWTEIGSGSREISFDSFSAMPEPILNIFGDLKSTDSDLQ